MTTLHLVKNTPYGGHRGRCSQCGKPLTLNPGQTLDAFTDAPDVFANPPECYVACKKVVS